MSTKLPKPLTRIEHYLNKIAKGETTTLPKPLTRIEKYLNEIANNGGGGGGGTAATTTYDNTTSGLTATNVQDAIDEIAAGSGGGDEVDLIVSGTYSVGTGDYPDRADIIQADENGYSTIISVNTNGRTAAEIISDFTDKIIANGTLSMQGNLTQEKSIAGQSGLTSYAVIRPLGGFTANADCMAFIASSEVLNLPLKASTTGVGLRIGDATGDNSAHIIIFEDTNGVIRVFPTTAL